MQRRDRRIIHTFGEDHVLVEVNCETDFVAKNDDFKSFVRDIAMHIAASNPLYISKEDVPKEVIDQERSILKAQALNEGKPEKVVEKMVEGRLKKFYQEICLLEQAFVKDPDKTVDQMVKEKISIIGENIKIRRFARFQMGEGLEKRSEDFAEEVRKQMG